MAVVHLALSVLNRHGQYIFAKFDDATEKKDRLKIYRPKDREYWKESEIQSALEGLCRDLRQRGYTTHVVTIHEYNRLP